MKSYVKLPIEVAKDPLYCGRECPHYGRAMGLHQCGLFGNLRLSPNGVHRAFDCVKTEATSAALAALTSGHMDRAKALSVIKESREAIAVSLEVIALAESALREGVVSFDCEVA